MTNPPQIVQWCAAEVQRQDATPLHVAGMYRAWEAACYYSYLSKVAICDWADNVTLGAHSQYRKTPASFANTTIAPKPDLIPRQMSLLFEAIDERYIVPSPLSPEEITKWFLDIHPFGDGNGRCAALLYNWLCGTLGNPVPLPNFYMQEVAGWPPN